MKYLGIDASTKSLAWGLIEDSELLAYGEIFFMGSTFELRLKEARTKTLAFMDIWDRADYIIFERAIIGPNREVALKLAQIFGVMKSCLADSSARLVEAPPMVWQEAIGNTVFRGRARTEFLKLHPEWKTKAKQSTGVREFRKNVTREIVIDCFGEDIESDNITDGIGLALFGQKTLRRTK